MDKLLVITTGTSNFLSVADGKPFREWRGQESIILSVLLSLER